MVCVCFVNDGDEPEDVATGGTEPTRDRAPVAVQCESAESRTSTETEDSNKNTHASRNTCVPVLLSHVH